MAKLCGECGKKLGIMDRVQVDGALNVETGTQLVFLPNIIILLWIELNVYIFDLYSVNPA